jgi:hypothetical protein
MYYAVARSEGEGGGGEYAADAHRIQHGGSSHYFHHHQQTHTPLPPPLPGHLPAILEANSVPGPDPDFGFNGDGDGDGGEPIPIRPVSNRGGARFGGAGAGHHLGERRGSAATTTPGLQVQLTEVEKTALRREIEHPYSEWGIIWTALTVSMAAFLQGGCRLVASLPAWPRVSLDSCAKRRDTKQAHPLTCPPGFVQSSLNSGSLYGRVYGLSTGDAASRSDEWHLGAANASPYFFATVLGCPLALPANHLLGRRGAVALASVFVFGSSLGAAWCRSWVALFAVHAASGVGMGLKAVSTPILASETAAGLWRGSSLLAWQLW